MEEVINNHLQRMKSLQSVYEERTGQHNILGILINELTEQLRQYNVVRQSEQLKGDEHKSAEWRSKNLGYGSKGEMVYIK